MSKKVSLREVYAQVDGRLSERECIKKLMFTKQFPGCLGKIPKDWDPRYISAREYKFVGDDFFWAKRAVAIFEVEKDSSRLARNLALAARCHLFRLPLKESSNCCWSGRYALEALAVNDVPLIERVYASAIYPKKRDSYYQHRSLIANAIRAGIRVGLKDMQRVLKERPRKPPESHEKGVWDALLGIAKEDAELFEQGIIQAAKEEQGKFFLDSDEGHRQGFETSGLLQLAKRLSPELLEGFHWKKIAPWYRALFDWTNTQSLDLSTIDLREWSIDLHRVWMELETPHWAGFQPKHESAKDLEKPQFGFSKEHWKVLCSSAYHLVEASICEKQYQQLFCKHYKLPGRETKYFGQLQPNLSVCIQDVIDQTECKKLEKARRFENRFDYYIVNVHNRYSLVYCACLGSLGREHLDQHATPKEAREAAASKIEWLKKKGFKEVPMATPEFELAKKLEKQNQPIPIGFSEEDSRQFNKEFNEHWKRKMAAREEKKKVRPKAKLKTEPMAKAKKSVGATTATKKKGTAVRSKPAPPKTTKAVAVKSASVKVVKNATQSNAPSRRFEFVEGNSSKFWQIVREGRSVSTTWGRIGTSGQNKKKDFTDDSKAQAEFDKLIREKSAKGYVEV